MRVNSNISSLQAQRQLSVTTKVIAKSFARLASGSRIVSGQDDAAGLAMASGLEAQKRSIVRAIRNFNDTLGFLNTADGVLQVQSDLVGRMRELSVQAANGSLSSADRNYLNQEMQSLLSEFSRLTESTDFNGVKLLDGTFGQKSIQVGSQKNETVSITLSSMKTTDVFRKTTGDGTFQTASIERASSGTQFVDVGDFNNDGRLDIATANVLSSSISVFMGQGDGTFQVRSSIAVSATSNVRIADVNRDGLGDLISTESGSIAVHLGRGNGTFQTRVTYLAASSGNIRSTTVVDVNNDNILDILGAVDLAGQPIKLFLGVGDGTFVSSSTMPAEANSKFIAAGDINNDGRVDFVSTDSSSATMGIYLGNGDGTFQNRTTMSTGTLPLEAVLTDFNEDNNLDVVVGDTGSATVSIYFGNGNGTFQTRTTLGTGTTPSGLSTVDINGDLVSDLLVSDYGSNTISIFVGNGDGTFKSRRTIATGVIPYHLVVADMNRDGVLDIVNNNYTSATVGIHLGNAQTIAAATSELTISTVSAAENMLGILDNALDSINSARAQIGAYQNRFEIGAQLSSVVVENLSSAVSQIKDVDISQEIAELTRLQVLRDLGVAAFSKANLNLNMIKDLLSD